MIITNEFGAAEICVEEEYDYGPSSDCEFCFMYKNLIEDFYVPYCNWFQSRREPLAAIWKGRKCNICIYRETSFKFKMHINWEP